MFDFKLFNSLLGRCDIYTVDDIINILGSGIKIRKDDYHVEKYTYEYRHYNVFIWHTVAGTYTTWLWHEDFGLVCFQTHEEAKLGFLEYCYNDILKTKKKYKKLIEVL